MNFHRYVKIPDVWIIGSTMINQWLGVILCNFGIDEHASRIIGINYQIEGQWSTILSGNHRFSHFPQIFPTNPLTIDDRFKSEWIIWETHIFHPRYHSYKNHQIIPCRSHGLPVYLHIFHHFPHQSLASEKSQVGSYNLDVRPMADCEKIRPRQLKPEVLHFTGWRGSDGTALDRWKTHGKP